MQTRLPERGELPPLKCSIDTYSTAYEAALTRDEWFFRCSLVFLSDKSGSTHTQHSLAIQWPLGVEFVCEPMDLRLYGSRRDH